MAQKAGNKEVWPKKQVNKPLLNPATFCRTLCRGQKFEILQNLFAHCLQSVWQRPMKNSRSKRCCLDDHIPIWKQKELSGTYGIWMIPMSTTLYHKKTFVICPRAEGVAINSLKVFVLLSMTSVAVSVVSIRLSSKDCSVPGSPGKVPG